MKSVSQKKAHILRKTRNQDILRRMDRGESLTSFNSYASWYPPRPIIEKDAHSIRSLYGSNPDVRLERSSTQNNDEKKDSSEIERPLRLA